MHKSPCWSEDNLYPGKHLKKLFLKRKFFILKCKFYWHFLTVSSQAMYRDGQQSKSLLHLRFTTFLGVGLFPFPFPAHSGLIRHAKTYLSLKCVCDTKLQLTSN